MTKDEAATAAQRLEPVPARGSTYELVVVQGPSAGAKIDVAPDSPRKLVGQSRLCDFQLEDRQVSRRHLAVESTPLGLHVRDVGSTNGTFFSGVRIESATFVGGETFVVGQTHVQVRRVNDMDRALSRAVRFGRFIGASAAMRKCYPLLKRLASGNESVVIEGEEGTGKDLLAEALHEESARAAAPFVVFECAIGDVAAAESGLAAAFEQANGGTLVLDEVAELPTPLQDKLLGLLQNAGDVRTIATSRRDLDQEIAAGRFKEDLYYRLAAANVEVPPLRERAGDVELLARHFWSKLGGAGEIPATVVDAIVRASWPGNVRELRNEIARLIARGSEASSGEDGGASAGAREEGAAELFQKVLTENLTLPVARQKIVAAFEQRYIEYALAKAGGNVSAAAASSGVARRYFYIVKNRRAR